MTAAVPRGASSWYRQLAAVVARQGGMFNAHLHLDRCSTLDDRYLPAAGASVLDACHGSLHRKHALIASLHRGPAYQRDDFFRRVHEALDDLHAVQTVRADTLVDVTADAVGLTALDWMLEIQRARAGDIELRCAAYSPFGFRDDEPAAWDIMVEGARRADFIACLPEADDVAEYPDHIGFMTHCQRMLELAQALQKPLHVHTDQRNEASERGTEQLIEAVRRYGAPAPRGGEPSVWAIHVISPSTYDEARFERLVAGLVEHHIGIITCPSAALGMRMYRPLQSPTYNSIPRILEMLAAGVWVRLGSDNVADMCSPSTTTDLTTEAFVLSSALRFYHADILARLLCGQRLAENERRLVVEHLARNQAAIDAFLSQQSGR